MDILMTQPSLATLELNDEDWLAICENVPSPLTKTDRSRLLVEAVLKLMSMDITWAEATPEPLGETTLYATVNAWAYKDAIGPLVAVLHQRGLTAGWDISKIEPATLNKRPHLKQFIGLKLLELKGLHPPVFYTKDWVLAAGPVSSEFTMTPELKARNAKFRAKLRRRKKKMAEGLIVGEGKTLGEQSTQGITSLAA
jgi:hypothetical protein